ncbi:hypothetical protein TOK_1511 [Pseudonocardia sp. N23]|nr:hypothetical protein TOK_1511 [Pseudonocardia sp. N23]
MDALTSEVRGLGPEPDEGTDLTGISDRIEALHRTARRENPTGTEARWRRVADDADKLARRVARLQRTPVDPTPAPARPAPAATPARTTRRASTPRPPAEPHGQRWVRAEPDATLHRVISGQARRTICGQPTTPGLPDLSADPGRRCPLCSIGDPNGR